MSRPDSLKLHRDRCALLVVDIQDRLSIAMNEEALSRVVNRVRALLTGAQALSLPVVLTEQYPKGLGRTLPVVHQHAPAAVPIEKLQFSAAIPEVRDALKGRDQVLIAGMEAHVCVFQTVRDFCAGPGTQVFVCADAVLSRHAADLEVGLELCRSAGAVITTAETALFDLIEVAGTPEFKAVSQAVK